MEGIWQRLVPSNKRREFFEKTLIEWLFDNLRDHSGFSESLWSTVFAIAVWWSWKWRCGNVFGTNGKCRDQVRWFIRDMANGVTKAFSQLGAENNSNAGRVERFIGWSRPSIGWVKLNTDGALRGNPGLAAAGGVLRNGDGAWCGGFAVNIGICSAPLGELWGVYYGLFIAWERQLTQVELEVDSEMVVDFLTTGINDSHTLSFLVRLCHDFLSKDWSVRIVHVYREANRLADGVANYVFSLPLGFHLFESSLDEMAPIVLEDSSGTVFPRFVRL